MPERLLTIALVALPACEWAAAPTEPERDLAARARPRPPAPRVEFVELGPEPTRREHARPFTDAPMIALQRIDSWTPAPGRTWPPITSKSSGENIWPSQLVIGPRHYWRQMPAGLVGQTRDLDPAAAYVPEHGDDDVPPQLLGVAGDLLVYARAAGRRVTRIDIYTALDTAPEDPSFLCDLYWPQHAVDGELSAWHNGVGPVLVDDEAVILGERSVTHASLLDGEVRVLELDYEPHSLEAGAGRVAWTGRPDDETRTFVAVDEFTRVLSLPIYGSLTWAGDSLLIRDRDRVLRWTEDEPLTELSFDPPFPPPAPNDYASKEQLYAFGDGEVVWLFMLGQPLRRVDARGFVRLDIALPWPTYVVAGGGELVWEVASPERMDVYATQLGWGLGLDRAGLRAASGR